MKENIYKTLYKSPIFLLGSTDSKVTFQKLLFGSLWCGGSPPCLSYPRPLCGALAALGPGPGHGLVSGSGFPHTYCLWFPVCGFPPGWGWVGGVWGVPHPLSQPHLCPSPWSLTCPVLAPRSGKPGEGAAGGEAEGGPEGAGPGGG